MEGDNRQFIWLLLLVISIHSLRMEGDFLVSLSWTVHGISIHSLRMEGDTIDTQTRKIILKFQSTPSAWRETPFQCSLFRRPFRISIHSLRMEGDRSPTWITRLLCIFQSTPSAWRETASMRSSASVIAFQSTPSAWRETPPDKPEQPAEEISIHSLRMEGDFITCTHYTPIRYFNPLPPHGGRPIADNSDPAFSISIHSLRMEGDGAVIGTLGNWAVFQSTPSAWRETGGSVESSMRLIISIHSLRMEGDVTGQRNTAAR